MIVDGAIRCGRCRDFKPCGDFAPSYVKRGRGTCRDCVRASASRQPAARAEWYRTHAETANRNRRAAYWSDPDAERRKRRDQYCRTVAARPGAYNETKHLERIQRLLAVSPGQYRAMFEAQGGRCAICHKAQPDLKARLAVDHCHDTGRIRGLLCRRCNTGLGALGDDVEGLTSAVGYLTRVAPQLGFSMGLVLG